MTTTATATTPPKRQQLDPLTSVAVVIRSCSAELEALSHVVSLISSFLDFVTPKRWSIERACERGLGLRMLRRLAAHEASEGLAMDPFYRAYLASKALVAAVRNDDDVETVRWICCEYCPRVVPVKAMAAAAKYGRLRILQYLFERYPSAQPNVYIADSAVEGGQLAALEWIFPVLESPEEDVGGTFCYAATWGRLEIVQWLDQQYCRLSGDATIVDAYFCKDALADAISNGHFEVARYLVDRGVSLVKRGQVPFSARSGDLDMIQWLHACRLTHGTFGWIDIAASSGYLHIVEWAHENIPGETCSIFTMDEAARRGHFDIVRWLHANRKEGCTRSAMDHAATYGHIDIVRWLHTNRTEGCTKWAMDLAAKNGHADVLRWLHKNRTEGCTTTAMDGAASSGHLEIVKWLHATRSEGCTTTAMDGAAAGGHLEVVQWLHRHRTEGCTVLAMDQAAENGHLDVVKWLHENRTEGCTTHALDRSNSFQILQWLLENRSEGCTARATQNAVHMSNFKKLLLLKEKGLDFCNTQTGLEAIRHGHFEIFQWLRACFPELISTELVETEHDSHVEDEDAWEMFVKFDSQQHTSRTSSCMDENA